MRAIGHTYITNGFTRLRLLILIIPINIFCLSHSAQFIINKKYKISMRTDSIMLIKAAIVCVLMAFVESTLTYGSYANHCPMPGEVEFVVTERTSNSPISYNWISNFLNAD